MDHKRAVKEPVLATSLIRSQKDLFCWFCHDAIKLAPPHDGVEGTLTRIKAAQQFVVEFGVATECGLGRRPPDTIPALLRIHSQVAEPVSG